MPQRFLGSYARLWKALARWFLAGASLLAWVAGVRLLWPLDAATLQAKNLIGIVEFKSGFEWPEWDDVVGLSHDGQVLAIRDPIEDRWGDQPIKIWDTSAGIIRCDVKRCFFARLSPDGRTLAADNADVTVDLWDIPTGTKTRNLRSPTSSDPNAWRFTDDGRIFATVEYDFRRADKKGWDVKLWDVASGLQIVTFPDVVPKSIVDGMVSSAAYPVEISPDGAYLAFTRPDGSGIVLIETKRGSQRILIPPTVTSGHRYDLLFSPDGRTLACIKPLSELLCLWDLETGRLRTLYKSPGSFWSMAFSADSKRLAVSFRHDSTNAKRWSKILGKVAAAKMFPEEDHTIILDATTGRPIMKLPFARIFAFGPDGKTFVMCSEQESAVLHWDLAPRVLFHGIPAMLMFAIALSLSTLWWHSAAIRANRLNIPSHPHS